MKRENVTMHHPDHRLEGHALRSAFEGHWQNQGWVEGPLPKKTTKKKSSAPVEESEPTSEVSDSDEGQ